MQRAPWTNAERRRHCPASGLGSLTPAGWGAAEHYGSSANGSGGQTTIDLKGEEGRIHLTLPTFNVIAQTPCLEESSLFLKQSLDCSKQNFFESF